MIRNYNIDHIFILGIGVSGMSLAIYLSKKKIKYSCWDDNPKVRMIAKKKNLNIKKISEENLIQCDFLVLSPGINHLNTEKHQALILAKKLKIQIITDLELLRIFNSHNKLLGVTGTNGKSTTTHFIDKILSYNNFIESKSCGNIGIPFTDLEINQNTTLVTEISSYQLAKIKRLKFNYAFLLNLSSDHLDWHGSMKNYIDAKLNIFRSQDKHCYAIICTDDKYTREIADNFNNKFNSKLLRIGMQNRESTDIYFEFNNETIKIFNNLSNEVILIPQKIINFTKAKHNFSNLLTAYTAGFLMKQSKEIFIEAVKDLKNLEHRTEFLGRIKKINFYNDSKSTNMNSAKTAINAFSNIFWILGGREKTGGLNGIERDLKNIKNAYSYGESGEKIKYFLNNNSVNCKNYRTLEESFNSAFEDAIDFKDKANIIFSPACSSFDQFKNFETRGNKFKKLVFEKLKMYEKKY